MIGISMVMLTLFTLAPQELKAQVTTKQKPDPNDNVFDGTKCTGSGEYCWAGSTEPDE